MNYREKFKRHYGINFGQEYHIHHIDMNHENDDISNLMILPASLHGKYHQSFQDLCVYTSSRFPIAETAGKDFLKIFMIYGTQRAALDMNALKRMIEVHEMCKKWYDYKQYLDGEIPNVHGIEL